MKKADKITEFQLFILYIKPAGKHACTMQTTGYRGHVIVYCTGREAGAKRFREQCWAGMPFDLVCIEYAEDIREAVELAEELKMIDPAVCLFIKAKSLADLERVEADKAQSCFSVALDVCEKELLSRAIEEHLQHFTKDAVSR